MHEQVDVMAPEKETAKPNWCADDALEVTIDVIIQDATGSGNIYLQSDPTNGGVPIVQEYIAEFNNNQPDGSYVDGFLVNFYLPADQGQNANWTFDNDPIWTKLIDKHGSCPRNKNDNNPNILLNPTLSADKRTLTVGNPNTSVEYFGFALRFSAVAGGKTLTYDPIGSNQNGSSFN